MIILSGIGFGTSALVSRAYSTQANQLMNDTINAIQNQKDNLPIKLLFNLSGIWEMASPIYRTENGYEVPYIVLASYDNQQIQVRSISGELVTSANTTWTDSFGNLFYRWPIILMPLYFNKIAIASVILDPTNLKYQVVYNSLIIITSEPWNISITDPYTVRGPCYGGIPISAVKVSYGKYYIIEASNIVYSDGVSISGELDYCLLDESGFEYMGYNIITYNIGYYINLNYYATIRTAATVYNSANQTLISVVLHNLYDYYYGKYSNDIMVLTTPITIGVYDFNYTTYTLTDQGAVQAVATEYSIDGVRYAAFMDRYFAGYDGEGLLVTYDAEAYAFNEVNLAELADVLRVWYVDIINATSDPVIVIVATLVNGTNAVFLMDFDQLTIIRKLLLTGYSGEARASLGLLAGEQVLYIAVPGHLLVVSLPDLALIGDIKNEVAHPKYLHYGLHGDLATLVVAGYTLSDEGVSYVYMVTGKATPTSITLEAPPVVYAGEAFQVMVNLTTKLGDPISGATVIIEEYDEAANAWKPVAALETGSDGLAVGQVVLVGRGPHLIRAHYPGNPDALLNSAYSNVIRVVAVLRVSASIRLSANTTIEGLPVDAIVSITRFTDGKPVSGVWVSLEVNTSTGWAVAGAGVTNDNGVSAITLNLPAGSYKLRVSLATSYLELESYDVVLLRVYPPMEPPPEGPYISPIGRILAFAPPMADIGDQARVVFAFYYGEHPVTPTTYDVQVIPSVADVNISEISTGVYIVEFTPQSSGVYTVLFTAYYNYAVYVGAANLYVYDLDSRLATWENEIFAVLDDLRALNQTLLEYLKEINASIREINMTEIRGLIVETRNGVATLLLHFNESIALLNNIGTNITELIDTVGEANKTITALVLSNWQSIKSLNDTIAPLIERIGEDVSDVKALITQYGELVIVINASIQQLAKSLSASLIDVIREVEGQSERLIAVINSSVGLILANIDDIGYSLSVVNETTVRINTALGSINVKLNDALDKLGIITGMIQSLSEEINGLIIEVQLANGTIVDLLLNQIHPEIISLKDNIALVNTTIGILAANLTTLGDQANRLLAVAETTREEVSTISSKSSSIASKLDEISRKIDELTREITDIRSSLEGVPTEESVEEASNTASQARLVSMAAAGLSILSLVGLILTSRRSH